METTQAARRRVRYQFEIFCMKIIDGERCDYLRQLMMKRKSSIPEEKLLPYETICAATRGDPDAMTKVLRHFDGYISYQATRIFYDEYGQSYRGVDAELKQRIQDKLVARIMERFRPE